MLPEPFLVIGLVTAAFDALGIEYLVGGSIASSVHGAFRSTNDVDFVAAIAAQQADSLAAALGADFYADPDMIRDAVAAVSSFNVIHLPTMIKADVFIRPSTPFADAEWSRRERVPLGQGDDAVSVNVASVEDMILQKLHWYRLTGERSDRQWGDIQGMLKVRGSRLDFTYLSTWADGLGLTDLLLRARDEAGV